MTLRLLKKSVHECKLKERAKRLKREVDEKEREKIYEPVEKLIETIFSSWVCLNHSFCNVSCSFIFCMCYLMTFVLG